MENKLYKRMASRLIEEARKDTPAILLHGPRQSGKTTLAQMQEGFAYVSLDNPNTLHAVQHDPIGFVENLDSNTIIDEIQRAPELLPTLKWFIDRDRRPGRYLLTGSANLLHLSRVSESLAGRMEIVSLLPLAQAEINQRENRLIEMLFSDERPASPKEYSREHYIQTVLAGGFPEPVHRPQNRRKKWHLNYVRGIIERDLAQITRIRNPDSMQHLLRNLSSVTAQLLNVNRLATSLGLTQPTVDSYIRWLERVFLVYRLEAWHSQDNKRLVKAPKMHVIDTGICCALLGLGAGKLFDEPVRFGPLLETFAVQEIHKLASCSMLEYRLSHYRDQDQNEVDLIVENEDNRCLAVEVKASQTIAAKDFRGINRFADKIGSGLAAGIVLYLGDQVLSFGPQRYALPLAALF